MGLTAIGRIVHLQIQTSSLKLGPRGEERYDPAPLLPVDALLLTRHGVSAVVDSVATLDVHNDLHPSSKNVRGINDVSVGFTSHYARMRERLGTHLRDGIAGENILVETTRSYAEADLAGRLVIEGADGRRIELASVVVAHPCVPFSRFALDDPAASPHVVSDVLRFLDGGTRGFYATLASEEPLRVEVGDVLYRVVHVEEGPGDATTR